jgi:hypothetical protein
MTLADDSSPAFTARAMNVVGAFYADIDKLKIAAPIYRYPPTRA